jgi:ferritin-like metal-binding protein YciE
VADLNARDTKLVQYLNEAYGKERQLETALEAHIAMTTRQPYKKRLQQHLQETKGHAREVARRIKQLGGTAEAISVPGPPVVAEAAEVVQEVAQRGVALAQGPLHAVRGTGEQEKLLKNAKTEYSDEAEEIANYKAIETFADSVGDKETAKIARAIRRQEERMADFLSRLIPTLTKSVVQAEVPAALRNGARRRSSGTRTSARRTTGSRSRASSSRSGTRSTARSRTGSRTTARSRTTPRSTGRRTTSRASGRSTRSTARTSSRAQSGSRAGGKGTTSRASSGARRSTGRSSSRASASRR